MPITIDNIKEYIDAHKSPGIPGCKVFTKCWECRRNFDMHREMMCGRTEPIKDITAPYTPMSYKAEPSCDVAESRCTKHLFGGVFFDAPPADYCFNCAEVLMLGQYRKELDIPYNQAWHDRMEVLAGISFKRKYPELKVFTRE